MVCGCSHSEDDCNEWEGYLKENRRRLSHVYHIKEKVFLNNVWETKLNQDAYRLTYAVHIKLNDRFIM